MSVRDSLLALLTEQPRYGYELKTEFESRTGHVWPLNIGQVYTTLDRLERDGLTEKQDEDADGRIRHAITAAGREAAREWLQTPLAMGALPRNELAIKVAVAISVDPVEAQHLIDAQRIETLAALQRHNRERRRPSSEASGLLAELQILVAEAELRWLEHCQTRLATRPGPTTQGVVS